MPNALEKFNQVLLDISPEYISTPYRRLSDIPNRYDKNGLLQVAYIVTSDAEERRFAKNKKPIKTELEPVFDELQSNTEQNINNANKKDQKTSTVNSKGNEAIKNIRNPISSNTDLKSKDESSEFVIETLESDSEGKTGMLVDKEVRDLTIKDMQTGEIFDINTNPFIIGKSQNVDLRIPYKVISRRHAAIIQEGSKYYIKDMRSTNGTYVAGQKIPAETEVELKDGEDIILANRKFKIRFSNKK